MFFLGQQPGAQLDGASVSKCCPLSADCAPATEFHIVNSVELCLVCLAPLFCLFMFGIARCNKTKRCNQCSKGGQANV